ncbi:MAG: FAD-binding protein, partial [Desulfurococcales archaeon]|nr:FAD-binding protein [Desulfurococcales archaeon]
MDIVDVLRKKLGKEKVIDDPAIVSIYLREPSGLRGSNVKAVVFPESGEDVREIVKAAYEYEVYIYPQGSSTSLSGSAYP